MTILDDDDKAKLRAVIKVGKAHKSDVLRRLAESVEDLLRALEQDPSLADEIERIILGP